MQGWGIAVLVGVPNEDDSFKTHPMNVLNERTLKGTFFGILVLPIGYYMFVGEQVDQLGVEKLLRGFFFPLLRPRRSGKMDHYDESGCQAPEGPILCINSCGFFGSATTMNMYSKCHKDLLLKQEQAKLAASSIDSIGNGSSSSSKGKDPVIADVVVSSLEPKILTSQEPNATTTCEVIEVKPKEGPNRCNACRKCVGLTGFNCHCGNLFCNLHCYSGDYIIGSYTMNMEEFAGSCIKFGSCCGYVGIL